MSSYCSGYSTQGSADVYCPFGCTATVISFSVQQSGQVVLLGNSTCNATFYVLANNQQVGNFLQGQAYNLYAQAGVVYTVIAQLPSTGLTGTCTNTVYVCSSVPLSQQPPPPNYMQYAYIAIIVIIIIAILAIIYKLVQNIKLNLAVPIPA